MKIFLVIEDGPNGDSWEVCRTRELAEELVQIGKDFWKPYVEINKVPERTFTIKEFAEI